MELTPSAPDVAMAPREAGAPKVRQTLTRSQRALLRARRRSIQAGIVLAVAALVIAFGLAVRHGLAKQGIGFDFGYLLAHAGIDLSEGQTLTTGAGRPWLDAFTSSDTNAQALAAGLFNTLKAAVVAIVAATLLGTALGVGRLSTNLLVRRISFAVVEFVRNTPLLIQIVFWYFAVVLKFPPAATASQWLGGLIASRSGVYLPAVALTDGASLPILAALTASVATVVAGLALRRRRALGYGLVAAGLVTVAAVLFAAAPFTFDLPRRTRFGASGGTDLTPEFAALLLALTANGAAYLAEIVRGAIEALPRGQWEAAAALGLSRGATIRDVILPQVFRIVLPSFGNQYISLAKSTSLGIAIGYPDLFNVYGTISNQTGRNLEGIVVVMVVYLLLSWAISAMVNLANARLAGRGGAR